MRHNLMVLRIGMVMGHIPPKGGKKWGHKEGNCMNRGDDGVFMRILLKLPQPRGIIPYYWPG